MVTDIAPAELDLHLARTRDDRVCWPGGDPGVFSPGFPSFRFLTRRNSWWSRVPDRGFCIMGPHLTSLFSTLQPAMSSKGRLYGVLLKFPPRNVGIRGSVPAFWVSHAHADPLTTEPVPVTVGMFCCTSVLRGRRLSLSVQTSANSTSFWVDWLLHSVLKSCCKSAVMLQHAMLPLRSRPAATRSIR